MIKINTGSVRSFSENLKSLSNKINADVYRNGSIPGMFSQLKEVGLISNYFTDVSNKIEQIYTTSNNLSDKLSGYVKSLEDLESNISKNTPDYGRQVKEINSHFYLSSNTGVSVPAMGSTFVNADLTNGDQIYSASNIGGIGAVGIAAASTQPNNPWIPKDEDEVSIVDTLTPPKKPVVGGESVENTNEQVNIATAERPQQGNNDIGNTTPIPPSQNPQGQNPILTSILNQNVSTSWSAAGLLATINPEELQKALQDIYIKKQQGELSLSNNKLLYENAVVLNKIAKENNMTFEELINNPNNAKLISEGLKSYASSMEKLNTMLSSSDIELQRQINGLLNNESGSLVVDNVTKNIMKEYLDSYSLQNNIDLKELLTNTKFAVDLKTALSSFVLGSTLFNKFLPKTREGILVAISNLEELPKDNLQGSLKDIYYSNESKSDTSTYKDLFNYLEETAIKNNISIEEMLTSEKYKEMLIDSTNKYMGLLKGLEKSLPMMLAVGVTNLNRDIKANNENVVKDNNYTGNTLTISNGSSIKSINNDDIDEDTSNNNIRDILKMLIKIENSEMIIYLKNVYDSMNEEGYSITNLELIEILTLFANIKNMDLVNILKEEYTDELKHHFKEYLKILDLVEIINEEKSKISFENDEQNTILNNFLSTNKLNLLQIITSEDKELLSKLISELKNERSTISLLLRLEKEDMQQYLKDIYYGKYSSIISKEHISLIGIFMFLDNNSKIEGSNIENMLNDTKNMDKLLYSILILEGLYNKVIKNGTVSNEYIKKEILYNDNLELSKTLSKIDDIDEILYLLLKMEPIELQQYLKELFEGKYEDIWNRSSITLSFILEYIKNIANVNSISALDLLSNNIYADKLYLNIEKINNILSLIKNKNINQLNRSIKPLLDSNNISLEDVKGLVNKIYVDLNINDLDYLLINKYYMGLNLDLVEFVGGLRKIVLNQEDQNSDINKYKSTLLFLIIFMLLTLFINKKIVDMNRGE